MTHTKRRLYQSLALALTAHLAPTLARADDESEEAVIRARAASPSETVIGHAEIERTGAVTLADALRPQADVDIQGGGAAGGVGRLSLRGSAPEETLLVIDGLRVSPRSSAATVAGADPNLVPVSLLQRISLSRGPSSALWGANAVAGVIELTTREPVTPRAFTGTLQYSAYLSDQESGIVPFDDDDEPFEEGLNPFFGLRGQFTTAFREGDQFFVGGVSGGYTRGWAPNTQSHLFDATLKAGRVLSGGGTAYFWMRAFDSYTGAPAWGSLLASDAFDADDRQARRGAALTGVLRRPLGARMRLEAGASASMTSTTLYNPDADMTAGTGAVEALQAATEVQGRVAWTHDALGPFGAVTVGADVGHESLDAEEFENGTESVRGGVFVRERKSFGSAILDLAARVDADSLYGFFVSPRAALQVASHDHFTQAEVSVGRAFRPPTFSERAWPVFMYATPAGGAVGERGNPNVSVESAWGADAAVAFGGGARRWRTSLRVFGLYTQDLVRWALDQDRFWTPTNVDHAWSGGATLDGSLRVHPRVTLVGSAFWQTTRDPDGEEIPGRLRSKVTARAVWYARAGLRAWVEGLWFDRVGTDGRGEAWRGVFVNARVGWQFASGLGAFVLGENLLDTRFESVRGLPTPGRVVWVGLSLDVDED